MTDPLATPDRAPPPPEPSSPELTASRALLILVMYFVVQVIVTALVMIPFMASYGTQAPQDAHIAERAKNAAILPATLIALPLSGLAVFWLTRRALPGPLRGGSLASIGWTRTKPEYALICGGIGLGLSVLLVFIVIPLAPPRPDESLGPLMFLAQSGPAGRVGVAIMALLVAPPVEEFLFRGVLLRGFTRSWGVPIAVVAVSALFLALHLLQTTYWPAVVGISLLSVATVTLRLKTGSLGPGLAFHMAYNLVPALAMLIGTP
jgi:membrane protease YdiL (CAAX protease family)